MLAAMQTMVCCPTVSAGAARPCLGGVNTAACTPIAANLPYLHGSKGCHPANGGLNKPNWFAAKERTCNPPPHTRTRAHTHTHTYGTQFLCFTRAYACNIWQKQYNVFFP